LRQVKEAIVEPSKIGSVTFDLQLDWDRIGILLVGFGMACSGVATILYGAGFLVQALAHHV
jgi:hypothetical protein